MFHSSKPSSAIDTVTLVEGQFKIDPKTGKSQLHSTMLYSNQKTGITFGTCPFKDTVLSPETQDAFEKFAKLLERDFAMLVLEDGIHKTTHGAVKSQVSAESMDGLKTKGIGGS